ncbi:MAG: hypothetical protein R2705_02515 [Ilumatobacteraceae bacterium]
MPVDPTLARRLQEAAALRARARVARRTASSLDGGLVHRLHLRSGPGTWLGPAADAFDEALSRAVFDVRNAADDLVEAAAQLERRAAALEHE